jgi:hypothetical protein
MSADPVASRTRRFCTGLLALTIALTTSGAVHATPEPAPEPAPADDPFGKDVEPAPPAEPEGDGSRTVVTVSPDGRGEWHRPGSSSGSVFATYGGGAAATCSGFRRGDDPGTPEIEPDEHQYAIQSTQWIFREKNVVGELVNELIRDVLDVIDAIFSGQPLPEFGVDGPPLSAMTRTFAVYCDSSSLFLAHPQGNYLGDIVVGPDDAFLNPRSQIPSLWGAVQLERPELGRFPAVDRWGGHVVRNPAWLSIERSGWRTQMTAPVFWRGWQLALVFEPRNLVFDIDYEPADGEPVEPWSGTISCVTGDQRPSTDTYRGLFPSRPHDLADFAEPTTDTNRQACAWTAPARGTVTITARITFAVTFWANGGIEPQPDFDWTSAPATYTVGELRAVNVNSDG